MRYTSILYFAAISGVLIGTNFVRLSQVTSVYGFAEERRAVYLAKARSVRTRCAEALRDTADCRYIIIARTYSPFLLSAITDSPVMAGFAGGHSRNARF